MFKKSLCIYAYMKRMMMMMMVMIMRRSVWHLPVKSPPTEALLPLHALRTFQTFQSQRLLFKHTFLQLSLPKPNFSWASPNDIKWNHHTSLTCNLVHLVTWHLDNLAEPIIVKQATSPLSFARFSVLYCKTWLGSGPYGWGGTYWIWHFIWDICVQHRLSL